MTDNPFTMSDADLLDRYRRALAKIMTGRVEIFDVYDAASRVLFGEGASISTDYDPPPIPDRRRDWSAIDDATYDGGDPVGEGETEVEAILDLIEEMEAKND